MDGDIVFPLPAHGKKAFARGKLEAIAMDTKEARRLLEHQATEKGITFDLSSVTGPLTICQIKPAGVLVE